MPVSRLTGVQLLFLFYLFIFFLLGIPVVLFSNLEISKCLNTLFLLSPRLCFIIGFICELFVAHKYLWMS